MSSPVGRTRLLLIATILAVSAGCNQVTTKTPPSPDPALAGSSIARSDNTDPTAPLTISLNGNDDRIALSWEAAIADQVSALRVSGRGSYFHSPGSRKLPSNDLRGKKDLFAFGGGAVMYFDLQLANSSHHRRWLFVEPSYCKSRNQLPRYFAPADMPAPSGNVLRSQDAEDILELLHAIELDRPSSDLWRSNAKHMLSIVQMMSIASRCSLSLDGKHMLDLGIRALSTLKGHRAVTPVARMNTVLEALEREGIAVASEPDPSPRAAAYDVELFDGFQYVRIRDFSARHTDRRGPLFADKAFRRFFGGGQEHGARQFAGLVREFNQNSEARALTIDLRGTRTRNLLAMLEWANVLVSGSTLLEIERGKVPIVQAIAAQPDYLAIEKPVFVLVDGNTQGPAEAFAAILQKKVNATVVGVPTAGRNESHKTNVLDNGRRFSTHVGYFLVPDSRLAERGAPLVPDIAMPDISGKPLDLLLSAIRRTE